MWTVIWVGVALLLALLVAFLVRSNAKLREDAAQHSAAAQQVASEHAQATHAAMQAEAERAARRAQEAAAPPVQKVKGAVDVTPPELKQHLDDASRTSVVMFHAPWCGNCTAMQPAYDKYGKAAADGVHVLRVDCDAYPQVAEHFGIQGFPTIKRFEKGREVAEYQGDRTTGSLLAFASGH